MVFNSIFSVQEQDSRASITFHGGPAEILKITNDGFFVRGKRVPADDKEAEAVYKAFKAFLVHHALSKE